MRWLVRARNGSCVNFLGPWDITVIPQFARLAKPLTDLTSKRTPNVLQWGDEEEKAFQSLKAKLCDSHVLRIPLLGVPFCLHTDASGTAVGATLRQKDASGIEHPLAFVSQKLTTTQCRWSTIEREAYAIVMPLYEHWVASDVIFVILRDIRVTHSGFL